MNTEPNAVPESSFDAQAQAKASAPAAIPAGQLLYWSVRRELWENRSIYFAPLAVALVVFLGFLLSLIGLPNRMRALDERGAAHQHGALVMPYGHAAWLLALTALLVGIFYCLDALHGERRDRSILFWKSLPVSDLTTVISKAIVPLVVLPALTFAIAVALQWSMLLFSSAVLAMSGVGAATMWAQLPFFQMQVWLLYGLTVMALWHAPLYAWLLLVSGWARRATFLWAVLPPLAIGMFERIAFGTSHFLSLLTDRLIGFAAEAFAFHTPSGAAVDPHFIPLERFTPGRFLSSPGLWVGLIFAAIFLAAAARMRRYREPI